MPRRPSYLLLPSALLGQPINIGAFWSCFLGVQEYRSSDNSLVYILGVKIIVMETWELWEHVESVAGRDSQCHCPLTP